MSKGFLAVMAVLGLVWALAQSNPAPASASAQYVTYTPQAFAAAEGQKRVLFFAASWCTTCRAADRDINAKLSQIPKGVVIFKTDYDSEAALKQKYGIVRQHTFVYVNAKGEAIKKWSGGALAEIIANIAN